VLQHYGRESSLAFTDSSSTEASASACMSLSVLSTFISNLSFLLQFKMTASQHPLSSQVKALFAGGTDLGHASLLHKIFAALTTGW
jgi:hypothetical protein